MNLLNMKTTDYINYTADRGKVFVSKTDGMIMGYGIGLSSSDSIDNYDEVDCPEEFKGVEGYDNTIDDHEEDNIIVLPAARSPIVS